jgi:hypothetical protein
MKRLDLKKDLRALYAPSPREVEMVRVPKLNFLMIDGKGDPNLSPGFALAVQALYAAAYTLKFMIKKEEAVDYPVMALEGLWWADNLEVFRMEQRDDWKWTLMIMQPSLVTKARLKKAVAAAMEKKGLDALRDIRLELYGEGLAVQIMHIGPYASEGPTIEKLHSFALERGLTLSGKHHEIYLSDPRKVSPGKMKTVLRQPVRK